MDSTYHPFRVNRVTAASNYHLDVEGFDDRAQAKGSSRGDIGA